MAIQMEAEDKAGFAVENKPEVVFLALYLHHSTQNQSDIAERVLAQIEHAQSHEDHMDRIAHPFEIRLTEQLGHGRRLNRGGFRHKDRMSAFFITAGVLRIVLAVMMQIHGFAADWAGRIRRLFRPSDSCRSSGHKLMPTLLAQIFLMTMFVFSVAIKVCFVVAFRTAYLV